MNSSTDLRELFLSGDGRLARSPFWIAAGLLLSLAILYEAVAGTTLHLVTGWVVYPALLYCAACVLSKRLHDRGRSGWYAAPVLAALIAIWDPPLRFTDFIFAVVLVWATVELAVLRGEIGANRFGPSPIRVPVV